MLTKEVLRMRSSAQIIAMATITIDLAIKHGEPQCFFNKKILRNCVMKLFFKLQRMLFSYITKTLHYIFTLLEIICGQTFEEKRIGGHHGQLQNKRNYSAFASQMS